MTPLETAIYWVEYIIRHKGAPQMQSPAKGFSFWVYYSLDVIAFTVAIGFIVVYIFGQIIKGGLRSIKSADKNNSKLAKIKVN